MSCFNKDEKRLLDQVAGSRVGSDLLEDKICEAGQSGSEVPASTPVTGTGIVAGVIGAQTADFTWGAATDDNTAQTSLKYRVCLSDVAVTSLLEARQNGSWQSDWSKDLTSIDIYGLFPERDYFITVFVKGWDQQEAVYTSLAFTTPASALQTFYVTDYGAAAPGDPVTFDAAGSYEKLGLTFDTDAFNTVAEAVVAANASAVETVIYTNRSEETQAIVQSTVSVHIIGAPDGSISRENGFPSGHLIRCDNNDITVVNMTLSGQRISGGSNDRYLLYSLSGNLTSVNNSFRIIYNAQYDGRCILSYGFGAQNATPKIINCSFSNFGRIGALLFNTIDAEVKWCSFRGKTGDNYNAGIESPSSLNASFTENTFYNFTAEAQSSDGSVSVALFTYTFPGLGDSSTIIRDNRFVQCTQAVAVGFPGYPDPLVTTITKNVMSDCDAGITKFSSGAHQIDATNNYFGDPDINEAHIDFAGNTLIEPKAKTPQID